MPRIFVAFAVWLMLTATASAQVTIPDIFAGEGDPQTNSYLNMVFGTLFETGVGGADQTLISTLMTSFNVIFFAVGMLLLVYNVVVGVTETAHDGSVLGSRHSSLWGPIRMVTAAAMLIPLPTGYSGIQHGVAYVVNAGTATATMVWTQAVDTVVDDRLPITTPDYASLDGQFVQSIWRMELCRASYNQEVAKGGNLDSMGAGWASNDGRIYSYSLTERQGACGTIELPEPTRGFERVAEATGSDYATWLNGMRTAVDNTIGRIRPTAEAVAQASSERTAMPPTLNLSNDLRAWRLEHSRAVAPIVDGVSDAAQEDLQDVLENSDGSRLAASLKENGWTRAGFYYQTIARFSSDSTSVLQMLPETTPGDAIGAASNPAGGTFGAVRTQMGSSWWNIVSDQNDNVRAFLSEIANTYNLTVNWWNESVTRSNVGAFTNERISFADSGGEMSNYLPSMQTVVALFDLINPLSGDDPMVGLITLGNGLTAMAGATIAGLAVLAAVPFVGGAVGFIGTVLGWLLNGIGLAGVFLAFILPMIPTIIWAIAVGAFFILVIEAVFAAPLWAMAHLSMDNSGFSGRQARRGYVLLLSIFLTPVLMLFGLFAGMVLFRILGTLINGGFYYALSSATSATSGGAMSVVWLFGIFVVMLFMVLIYVVILERSFSLISEFPARVFRWFEEVSGSDLDGSTSARVHGAGGIAGGTTGAALGGAGGAGQRRIGARQAKSAEQAKDGEHQGPAGYKHPRFIGRLPKP